LGLPDAVAAGLAAYLDTLAEWGRRVNLTAARTPAQRVELLVEKVLPCRHIPEPGTLLDVGSGNGSPGLVLALLRDDLEVTLLEPRSRRWAFLREAVRRCAMGRVRVLRVRHDTYPGGPARTVTLRALSLPLEQLAPLVAPEGQLLILGGRPRTAGPFEEAPPGGARPGDVRVFRRVGRPCAT
jgi:16S rRNA (guanine527-N7)-methyltransferase